MMLRNIENLSPTKRTKNNSKIEHEIDNQGCKCDLCQKIVIKEMRVIKVHTIEDKQSQLTKGRREEFFSKFLIQFNTIDKMNRKVKVIFPEVCVFEKGLPTCLISKKRQTLPMKLIKNKQKLNGFEIHNFFVDGFTFHNNFKQKMPIMGKKIPSNSTIPSILPPINKMVLKAPKYSHSIDQALKSECIVLSKFSNGSCQMMTPIQLTNLFKSKQKQLRQDIIYISTMVCSASYNQIRINVDLDAIDVGILERAKNQVKMINEDIKPKDFQFVPQRDQRKFQEILKDQDPKKYLEYISLKLALLYSLKTDILFKDSIFKFVKDEIDSYYLIDIQVYSRTSSSRIWGNFDNSKAFMESPQKQKKRMRPSSSPERLQKNRQSNNLMSLNQIKNELNQIPQQTINYNFDYKF